MARRSVWLVTGVVAGAASSLYAERKLRRTLEAASARLQPDALVVEVGRTARQAARSTGGRVRDAVSTGRMEMQRREEEIWAGLGTSVPSEETGPAASTAHADGSEPVGSTAPVVHTARGRGLRRGRKSPSHLGK
jgi:hypothetical protein